MEVNRQTSIQFHLLDENKQHLQDLPWHLPLEQWDEQGVPLLTIRRGESRHPVVFIERQGVRYAIKETTPHMAEREIHNFHEIRQRGIPTLSPVGTIIVPHPPVSLGVLGPGGRAQYTSGDKGYTITLLAPRVVPHVYLYRLSLTRRTRQRLLSTVAILMIELHQHGVYWGDPSLANILIRIDGKHVLAIMADAETTELFSGTISDGLREQDLASFAETLAWQAEDLRQAHSLPESTRILDDSDFRYFERRYRWLRRQHNSLENREIQFATFYQEQQFLHTINRWGFSLLNATGNTLQGLIAVRPGWYQQRVKELLHIAVPRSYARRFYNTILGHQALLSKQEKRQVSIEEAARHWYTQYHLPAILLLRRVLTSGQDPMKAYFHVMLHKWKMSEKAGYEIPLEEAMVDWSMHTAKTGRLGTVDPALQAKQDHASEMTTEVLAPALIEDDTLDPLLSTAERPLVHLSHSEMETKLPAILDGTHEEQ